MEEKKMKNFHSGDQCPVRDILCRLGDKWSILVLLSLDANGTMRFSDIEKSLSDISQRMLAVSLRVLVADGFILRTVYAEIPPRVEYCLSDIGKELMPHIHRLAGWALAYMPSIRENRERAM